MSKFVCTALALIGAGAAAQADPESGAWLGLDQEISNLTSSLSAQGGGVDVGALIRSSYLYAEDTLGLTSPEDTGGFIFQDVDIWLEGEVGDYEWRINMDLDGASGFSGGPPGSASATTPAWEAGTGGSAVLEDAYATWNASDNFGITWGQFKAPVTMSTSIDPERMAFVDRTAIGQVFDGWQLGAMIHGEQEGFGWFVAIQNGADGINDEYRISGRAEFTIGDHESGVTRNGGAVAGGSDELAGTAGVFFVQDDGLGDAVPDNTIIGLDAAGTMGPFSIHAEVADFDTDIGDNTPFSFAFGYLFSDQWHGAVRFQDLDDAGSDASIFSIAATWLQGNSGSNGTDAAWTFEIGSVDAEDGFADGTYAQVNLSVGSTRN